MGLPRASHGSPVGRPCAFHGFTYTVVLQWVPVGLVGFPSGFHRFTVLSWVCNKFEVLPRVSHETPTGSQWCHGTLQLRFPGIYRGTPMGLL